MLEVFVWLPKREQGEKNVGHASMVVTETTYISWWPDQAVTLGDYHPIRNKSYASDCRDEGGKPDANIAINGLDEEAILGWWQGFGLTRNGVMFQGPLPPYNLVELNCSTVVARGLKIGGGDKYASWYSSWSVVWRPQTVLEYATSIKKALPA